ncbi:molybdate ABC transporter substrate-binding protein [Paenibacillus sp.]|jgi:molybdate transport system substrate-binding protein|uniref:molybdate ABC transporter substrate-binding protein n=1 Tax=Paenibacillus sp. TaxID=58172 RepID=UPI0028354DB0|nr:molybdate ABC transporter substrate-binding protein [Paenibacillus sp.]MDR0268100.1 molybdate ABC transporter substrate-binding protein [Paenibacillus sp.]
MYGRIKSNAVLCLLLVMILVLAACGNQTETKTDANANNAAGSDTTTSTTATAEKADLTISAAASMTDALNEIKKDYETAHPNITLNFNFGGSGALQKQIEQGAPADLFLSAAVKNMTPLVEQKLIAEDKEKTLLKNELVAVVPADTKTSIGNMEDLKKAEVKKIAIGIPESVPAGNYAKEALTNSKLWEPLQPKVVQAKDVRQVLQYVETGNADAGFVYKTDALTSSKVKIAFTVDPVSYSAVEYPIGIVKATKHSQEAEDFYNYLQSQASLDVFTKYGFTVPSLDQEK